MLQHGEEVNGLSTCFLTVFLCHVFFACVRVWRRLAWVCRHTFYIMVYLCVFRYRLYTSESR